MAACRRGVFYIGCPRRRPCMAEACHSQAILRRCGDLSLSRPLESPLLELLHAIDTLLPLSFGGHTTGKPSLSREHNITHPDCHESFDVLEIVLRDPREPCRLLVEPTDLP